MSTFRNTYKYANEVNREISLYKKDIDLEI